MNFRPNALASAIRIVTDGWAHERRLAQIREIVRNGIEKMRAEQIERQAKEGINNVEME